MIRCDVHGRPLGPIKEKKEKKLLAIVDQSRRMAGSIGVTVSLPANDKAAARELKKIKHGRLVTLAHPLQVGDHVFGHEVVPSHVARWG